jgi:hypothetical protein
MTAVELLVEEINKLTGLSISMDEPCVEQAKEREKEQIENAFNYGQLDLGMEADEYYNKIFDK